MTVPAFAALDAINAINGVVHRALDVAWARVGVVSRRYEGSGCGPLIRASLLGVASGTWWVSCLG